MAQLRVQGYLGLDGNQFFSTLNRADASVKRFAGGTMTSLTRRVGALFAVSALTAGAKSIIDYAGRLTDLSKRTGVAVEELQRFDRAATENGSSLETLVGFWDKLNAARKIALEKPDSPQAAAFGKLGITRDRLEGEGAAGLTNLIANAFKNPANLEEINQALREVGGRGATDLTAAFRAGMTEQYQSLQVMAAEDAAILDEMGDSWSGFIKDLQISFAPILIKIIDWLYDMKDGAIYSFETIKQFGIYTAKTLKDVFDWTLSGDWMTSSGGKFFQKLVEFAKVNAAAAWKEIDDVAVGVEAESRERKEKGKRRENQFAPLVFGDDAPPPPPNDKQRQAMELAQGDSLVRVGNFLGTGPSMLRDVWDRMIRLQERTAVATEKVAKNTSNNTDTLGLSE
jgi:hypothetical protein